MLLVVIWVDLGTWFLGAAVFVEGVGDGEEDDGNISGAILGL